jgi:CheY-like chemotaxis protein
MILLVENNSKDETWTQLLLNKNRITNHVHTVHDGEAALQFLSPAQNGERKFPIPDFILASSTMQKVEITEFIKLVRSASHTSDVPIIVLCASRDDFDRLNRSPNDRVFIMLKPLGFYKLIEGLHKLEMFWTIDRTPPAGSAV